MSAVTSALRAILIADPTVSAIVGTRIYLGQLPREPTFPAVTMDGVSGGPWGLNSSRTKPLENVVVQFSCWADDKESTSTTLARAIAECLHSYVGASAGIEITSAQVRSSPDAGTDYNPDTGIWMTPLDVEVRYK